MTKAQGSQSRGHDRIYKHGERRKAFRAGSSDKRFDSFAELYSHLPLEKCGYKEEELATASPCDMERYYSADEQKNSGVCGIEIELI